MTAHGRQLGSCAVVIYRECGTLEASSLLSVSINRHPRTSLPEEINSRLTGKARRGSERYHKAVVEYSLSRLDVAVIFNFFSPPDFFLPCGTGPYRTAYPWRLGQRECGDAGVAHSGMLSSLRRSSGREPEPETTRESWSQTRHVCVFVRRTRDAICNQTSVSACKAVSVYLFSPTALRPPGQSLTGAVSGKCRSICSLGLLIGPCRWPRRDSIQIT